MISRAAFALAAVLASAAASADPRPNFVVILIDDAAFTDLGAYGGEAHTPNLDMLAARGAMFTSYHTSPLCSPSRAMLLTGIDNHKTGVATIPETLPSEQVGKHGYSMFLEPGVDTVAQHLKGAGYRTYMSGKWHLGHGPGQLPDGHGFDHSLALDASGADNWQQKPYMPYYATADWFEDGKPVQLPENYYSSEMIVDHMIGYLKRDQANAAPFLAYVPFQAVHIPVQAPREFTAHYAGVYDGGWDATRERRWQRAKELHLIPADAELPPAHDKLRRWDAQSAEDKALFAKSMAVYAGMIEAMDANVGKLIAYLKETGQYDHTIFFVTSDNGPEPSDPLAQVGFATWMSQNGYERKIDTLGEKGSMNFIGPEWANAAASPDRLFKFHSAEGGLRVPLIVSGPGVSQGMVNSLSFVTDLTPTIYDYAGIDPATWNGKVPLTGKSLAPVLRGQAERTYAPDVPVGIEVGGNAALFKGDYKLTHISLPWGDAKWHLYHLTEDPGEVHDLSTLDAERYKSMLADYDNYAKQMGVLKLPDDFNPHTQVAINALEKQVEYLRVKIAAAAVFIIAIVIWLVRRRRTAADS
ncbi:MAG TPA: arylsulfatase [Nevskiaceae bacterium]|nr:arylsulfatase [Nevskiaceae bacterium]